MKKLLYLLLACVLCSALVFTACSKDSQEQIDEATETTETTEAEVTQEQIEKNIVGTWIKSEIDGQPALTNEKSVYDIVSINEAYTSASRVIDEVTPFDYNHKSVVDLNGNVVTITTTNADGESLVHEFTITSISDSELTANQKFTCKPKGTDPIIIEDTVSFVKVNADYSEDILGTWEGRCTSEGSIFDDGQDMPLMNISGTDTNTNSRKQDSLSLTKNDMQIAKNMLDSRNGMTNATSVGNCQS